jgi:hypothetical protein
MDAPSGHVTDVPKMEVDGGREDRAFRLLRRDDFVIKAG